MAIPEDVNTNWSPHLQSAGPRLELGINLQLKESWRTTGGHNSVTNWEVEKATSLKKSGSRNRSTLGRITSLGCRQSSEGNICFSCDKEHKNQSPISVFKSNAISKAASLLVDQSLKGWLQYSSQRWTEFALGGLEVSDEHRALYWTQLETPGDSCNRLYWYGDRFDWSLKGDDGPSVSMNSVE